MGGAGEADSRHVLWNSPAKPSITGCVKDRMRAKKPWPARGRLVGWLVADGWAYECTMMFGSSSAVGPGRGFRCNRRADEIIYIFPHLLFFFFFCDEMCLVSRVRSWPTPPPPPWAGDGRSARK